nr:MAG TPA: PolyVal ADP-Ribosyltransferase [Bacteriophage sp.]
MTEEQKRIMAEERAKAVLGTDKNKKKEASSSEISKTLKLELAKSKGKTIAASPNGSKKTQAKQAKSTKVSHNPIKGTLASIGVGAREGVKSAVSNAGTWQSVGKLNREIDSLEETRKRAQKAGIYNAQIAKDIDNQIALRKAQMPQLIQGQKEKNAASNARLQAVDDRYDLGRAGEFAQDLGGAFGQMLPSLGVGVVNPAAGLAAFGVQAAAQGYGQALDEGATHEQAARYGVGTGLLEAGIEKATGGLSRFYGRGVLDKALKIAPNNSVKNVIFNTAKGAVGEGAEEAVSAIADPYLQRATYDPAAENASFSDAAYQAAIGAALGGILGGGSNALSYRAGKRAAERAQTGAQGAQGERITIDTSAQDVGLNGDVESRRTAQDGRDFDESGHIDKRDYKTVGSRKMNAFSYDNPAVRPYYVAEAKRMQRELGEAQKPEMYFGVSENGLKDTDAFVGGHGRIASSDIVTARDEIGLSYKEIDKALDDIIEDSGRENNANAKKLEVLFDQNLSMGTESDGYHIPPNAGYIRTKEGIAGAKDYGYKAEQARYESGEYDPISEDPYAFESTVYAIAQRRGHELTKAEAEEVEALQEVIDADRTAFTEEEIRQMIDEQVDKWKAPRKEAQSPYEQAYDDMLRGEDRAKPKAETEDERRVKDFIQSAAVRARMQVKYVDRPLVQKAYYKDGVIYINKNRPMDEGVKVTVAHELYHAMEGTKEHDTIVRLAFEGKDAEAMIAEKIEKYRQNGVELDEEGARAEIGAEFIEKALTDEATINQVLLENRTLAGKIVERIKEIIDIYRAKKTMSAKEAREYAALLKAKRLYEDGLAKLHEGEYSPAGVERNARYSITKDEEGYLVNIDTDQDIFDGVPEEDYAKIAKMYIQDYLSGNVYQKDGNAININKRTEKKYPFAKDAGKNFATKMRLTPEIENMISVSETLETNIPDNGKHTWADSWDYYRARFAIGDKIFEGVLNIANTNTGEGKILYDINKIKEVRSNGYGNVSDTDTHLRTSFVNSNIPNPATNVNSKSQKNKKRFALDTKGEKDYQKRGKYLANSDENLRNFMKDSVVKNEDGTPKVVYSGHGNSNLFGGAWDIKKATSGGFYFTENPDIASSYAKDKLGNMETYANGDEYRFKNAKGEYKDTIDKVRLSDEQAAKFDAWLEDDMSMNFDDYVRENAPYDKLLQGLRYNGGKYNLQNVYKLMESLGYADNGWNYSTNSQGKSTFEELLDEMGIDWDSYTRDAGGVFPVYLDIKNPIDTSKPFPQDLMNELEYAASKERKSADADSAHWTKDYPLKEWVEDIKRGADGWATQVPTKARKIMLDRGYDGIKDTGGNLLGDTNHTVWVALEPTQIKSATGNRGTFDASKKDIRYALGDDGGINGERYNELIDEYGRIDEGMEPREDVAVPKQVNDWDKTRRFVRTAMESENVSAEAKDKIADSLASDIASGKFVYEPVRNQKLQEKANANIAKVGYEKSKAEVFAKYQKNERIKAEDVATLEQLIVKASAEGKAEEVMDMIGLASMIGTEMGQSIQALSMVKRMSPEGRLRQMTLLRDRLNSKYELTGDSQVEINSRYAEMMLDKNNSSENMDTIQSYIIDDMAKQLPVDMKDKFDAWRYLAMLGNPRTHIRNIVGNILNLSLSRINDQLAGVVEAAAAKKGLVQEGERTKSAGAVSKELREFAKRDWEEIGKKRTDLSNKYGERGQAERNRKIFTSKLMQPVEHGRKWNENMMDAEDTAFKKVQYIYALSHYMKANNITPEIMQIENSPIAERARQYAEDEAYRVTFQEANALASALNHFEHKNTDNKLEKGGQLAVKALMPFKKTPLNILKRGVEYSPAGLINGINDAIKLVRKGDIPATQVINEITQGLTGTGIVALGYFLAEAGLLSAGYDEGNKREQNYENQIGGQNYAITLPGGGTYTLDWAAPTVMPLFVGAALKDEISSREEGENIGLRDIGSALIKVTDPVLEMSCMDSLQSALESYGNEGAISNMITSAATSYVMQFVPTLSGQFARTIDETKRSTYAPSDSKYTKTGESLGRQFMNKVPGLSYKSEAAVDVWGRERKQAGGNIAGRAFNNMLSPGTYSSNKETATDKELKRLYESSGESGVLPKMGSKYISYKADGEKSKTYYLTSKEYTKYQTKYGQDNFKAVSELMRSNVYKKMSDEEKAAAVKEIYTYNAQMANKEFFKGRNVSYDAGASTTEKLKDAGGWANYFAIKEAFPDSNYDVAKKRKDKCDKYGINYTAYAESNAKIAELRSANSERYTKASDKTEANKRAIAQYLASRKDLTNPQRQVIWQEYYKGKTSETYKSVARRYGF